MAGKPQFVKHLGTNAGIGGRCGSTRVILAGGSQASNVFWPVGSYASCYGAGGNMQYCLPDVRKRTEHLRGMSYKCPIDG
jgi:hypothetical protein